MNILKALFVSTLLLFTQPSLAQEPCISPARVLEMIKEIDPNPSVLKYTGNEAVEISSALEEYYKTKNPYPFEDVEVFIVKPPSRSGGVIFVFYSKSCAVTKTQLSTEGMIEFMSLLKNRGVSFP